MKSVNSLIGIIIALFLFFSFSNFDNVDDVIQFVSGSATPIDEIAKNRSDENDTHLEKAILSQHVDGDTIKVEFSGGKVETIRLLLIDTPETVKPNTPEQPFGKEASDYMKQRLIKDTVVEIERGIEERDKYGRLLAYVYKDGELINSELLEKGLARIAYVYEPNTKYLDELKKAEKKARDQKIGIWSIENYVTDNGFNH